MLFGGFISRDKNTFLTKMLRYMGIVTSTSILHIDKHSIWRRQNNRLTEETKQKGANMSHQIRKLGEAIILISCSRFNNSDKYYSPSQLAIPHSAPRKSINRNSQGWTETVQVVAKFRNASRPSSSNFSTCK